MTRSQSSHAIVLSFVLLNAGLTVAQDPVMAFLSRFRRNVATGALQVDSTR